MSMRKLTGKAAILAAAICVAAALPSWAADRTISANYVLTSDETVDGVLTVGSGVTVDLAGHKLTVEGLGTAAGTITSSSAGGVLEVCVASGGTVNNSAITLTGGTNLQVWKSGAGSLVMSKANTGFGGSGATSLVVKAGYAQKVNSATYSCGAVNSIIVVESGGRFDLNGQSTPDYDYHISGSGPDGTGALVNNANVSLGYNTSGGGSTGFFRNLTLDGDAAVGGTYNWCLSNRSMKSNPITMNGHTLTNVIVSGKALYVGTTDFQGGGKIVVANGTTLATADVYRSGPKADTCEVVICEGGTLSLYKCQFSPLKSLIFDGGIFSMNDASGGKPVNYVTTVYDTYAPNLPANAGGGNYHPNPRVSLGVSGETATLDLSRFSSAFSNYDSAKNVTLTTFASENVNVYTGSRDIHAGDVLMTWNVAPTAEFALVCAGQSAAERKLGVKSTSTGLVVVSTARPDYAVRDVANSEWRFYSFDGTALDDWEGGIDGEMDVRFSSYAEYEAVKALASGISPRGYVMHGFALPAGGATYDLRNGLSFSLVSADVNGGTLILPEATIADAEAGATVTSSSTGGVFEINVGNGCSITNKAIAISGGANMKVVKTGPGTLTMGLQNVGFGANGTTSLVVRAGILRRATASTDSAYNSLGAEGSVVVVEDGATLDLVGRGGWKYDYVVSGSGTDGAGVLVSSASLSDPYRAKNGFGFIGKVTLTGNATLGGPGTWGLIQSQSTTYAPIVVDMGVDGNTLVIAGNVYLGAAQFVGNGEIVVANGARLLTAGYVNLPNATGCVVRVSNGGVFESYNKTFGTVKSLVFEAFATNSISQSSEALNNVTIYDTYAPNLPENKIGNVAGIYYLPVVLGSAGHLATTLDLSRHEAVFDTSNTTFYSGSVVTVNLSGRTNLRSIAKSASPYVVTWASQPANVEFVLDAQSRANGYRIYSEAEGLRLKRFTGMMLIVK